MEERRGGGIGRDIGRGRIGERGLKGRERGGGGEREGGGRERGRRERERDREVY